MDEKNEVKTPGEQSAEEKHTGYVVLGVFFPLIAIILWFMYKSDKPAVAVACRKGFLIGVIVYVVAVVLISLITCGACAASVAYL